MRTYFKSIFKWERLTWNMKNAGKEQDVTKWMKPALSDADESDESSQAK